MPFGIEITRIHALVVFLAGAFTAWQYHDGTAVSLYRGYEISPSGFDLSSFPFFLFPASVPVKLDLNSVNQASSSDDAPEVAVFPNNDTIKETPEVAVLSSNNDTANEASGGAVVSNNDIIGNASFQHSAKRHFVKPTLGSLLWEWFLRWLYTWLWVALRFYGVLRFVTDLTTPYWIAHNERKQRMDRVLDELLGKVRKTLDADRAKVFNDCKGKLEGKDTKIADLDEQLRKLNAKIEEKNGLFEKIKKDFKSIEQCKDEEIKQLKEQLEEKDGLLRDKDKTISSYKDSSTQTEAAATNTSSSSQTENRLRGLETQVHQRDEIIAGLQQSLANEARRNHSNTVSIQALRNAAAATVGAPFAAGQFANPAYGPRPPTTPYQQPLPMPPPNHQYPPFGTQPNGGRGGAPGGFQRGGFGGQRRDFGH
ncbi:MAG: hypothetical protein Q9191_005073 [Dirinaria sp. TL-2023a]